MTTRSSATGARAKFVAPWSDATAESSRRITKSVAGRSATAARSDARASSSERRTPGTGSETSMTRLSVTDTIGSAGALSAAILGAAAIGSGLLTGSAAACASRMRSRCALISFANTRGLTRPWLSSRDFPRLKTPSRPRFFSSRERRCAARYASSLGLRSADRRISCGTAFTSSAIAALAEVTTTRSTVARLRTARRTEAAWSGSGSTARTSGVTRSERGGRFLVDTGKYRRL